jgi:predicted SAM-dependent methyltransferase
MSELKTCKICQSPFSAEYTFREMMFGTRDEFLYHECSECGCLQIDEVPENIESYYPPYYYSFNLEIPELEKKQSGFLSIIQKLSVNKKERKSRKSTLSYLLPVHIQKQHKILDIGCGKGELICRLFNMGFEHVSGTDKYLPEEINYGHDVKVMKKDLHQIQSNTYDFVMMHHVLEHMFFPEEELKECYRILKNKSILMIRIPVKGFAWEKYKHNWVQLDAPRHFFIHTLKSMGILAEKTGFQMKDVIFDSVSFQFEGSELYTRDIPLYDIRAHKPNSVKGILNSKERKYFKKEPRRLNESKRGDQAIFYLYKD